ncbi:MAG TPA: ferritin-like domain-containing protein [Sphingobacteriaceae bacterium]|nr:ferritin-like domain-containing protein [Sphingobacteriaceae bacterium]
MKDLHTAEENQLEEAGIGNNLLNAQLQRRAFLRYAGASAAAVTLIAAGCKKDDAASQRDRDARDRANTPVNLGSGDVGILNFAYALEQLEAAFYIQVVATPYSGISAIERTYMTDIRDHEIAHREFFKSVLGSSAIPGLEVDFSSINFNSRDSVLGTARAFEDLGVSAYDGAGYLLKDANNLLLAGKIVSVEARHAALIRELISVNSFLGDQVDGDSVNISRTPPQVLSIAAPFIKTKINASNLPS